MELTVTLDEAAEPLGALVNYVKVTGALVYGGYAGYGAADPNTRDPYR